MEIFKETFEKSRKLREIAEAETKTLDLTKYTVKEFAEVIEEDFETISDLMKDCSNLGYTNKPFDNVVSNVQKSTIAEDKKEVVAKFIYTNLFNRPEHRFYNGRGWGTTLRSS